MKRKDLAFTAALLTAGVFPFLLAYLAADGTVFFKGFLLNPLDGHTYLSKIYQGMQGSWKFTLPYTSNPGEGSYLFLYYLFLGHVAGLLNISQLTIFHLARIINAGFLLFSVLYFIRSYLPDGAQDQKIALLTLTGSGCGWLLIASGHQTSDFWVAEMYPLLSSLANPHFPLGLGINPTKNPGFSPG